MTEQNVQYEKKLEKVTKMLKENPNQREEINKGIDRLIYLRGRLYEQNHSQESPRVEKLDEMPDYETTNGVVA